MFEEIRERIKSTKKEMRPKNMSGRFQKDNNRIPNVISTVTKIRNLIYVLNRLDTAKEKKWVN